ncbi:hypothetical protein [Shewanella surugensis]|nr:hypothetical protein [Shewanella surugensis]
MELGPNKMGIFILNKGAFLVRLAGNERVFIEMGVDSWIIFSV